jgi:hypothetical protein
VSQREREPSRGDCSASVLVEVRELPVTLDIAA